MQAFKPSHLLTVGIVGVIGYGTVARAVSRRQTVPEDRKTRNKIQRNRTGPGELVAQAAGPLGKEWFHIPVGAALGWFLWKHGSGGRSWMPLGASVTAEGLSRVLDYAPPHRKVPPGHPNQKKPSFPSGHAMETTAVALTSAYVLARENHVAAGPAFAAAAVLSLASPLGRMYLDRHWASDVIAGALAGMVIAAVSAAAFETIPQ